MWVQKTWRQHLAEEKGNAESESLWTDHTCMSSAVLRDVPWVGREALFKKGELWREPEAQCCSAVRSSHSPPFTLEMSVLYNFRSNLIFLEVIFWTVEFGLSRGCPNLVLKWPQSKFLSYQAEKALGTQVKPLSLLYNRKPCLDCCLWGPGAETPWLPVSYPMLGLPQFRLFCHL